jgi:hypothetical protein
MRRISGVALPCVLLLAIAGCDSGPPMGQVRGTVTLDSKPVKDAVVKFLPIDGQSAVGGGFVKDGNFEVQLAVNKFRVEFTSAQLPPGGIPKGKFSEEAYTITDLFPEKYNTKSELTLDVQAGVNEKAWDLKSR